VAIVKANYLRGGAPGTAARVRGAAGYYTWRPADGLERGAGRTWYAAAEHDGAVRELDPRAARAEIVSGAEGAAYTYRLVLSTREAELAPADYAAVLDRHFDTWYFTLHHEEEHPHAHAIAFADARLDVDDLRDLREQLAERELGRERALELGRGDEPALGY